MDLRHRRLPRAGPVRRDLDPEVLVGLDVEAPALERGEEPEAGAADVGGIAPADLVAAVGPVGRADPVDDGVVRRPGERADGRR